MRKRGGTVSGYDSVLWAKDGTSIPVHISASLLFDEDGIQIGTVGFATDLRERKRAQEKLQKTYDQLERRVEERTVELNEARGRLQYLLTVTPGIMYTNQVTEGYKCSFVSRNVDPIMGFSEWRCSRTRVLAEEIAIPRTQVAYSARWVRWSSKAAAQSNTGSGTRRQLRLDPRHVQGRRG